MPLPTYEDVMLPVLEILEASGPRHRRELAAAVADALHLSEVERLQTLPSGKATVIMSRVGWALAYLKQGRVVASPRRGVYQVTDRGKDILARKPSKIDAEFLSQFPEFLDFLQRARAATSQRADTEEPALQSGVPVASDSASPEEALDAAYGRLRTGLEEELLEAVKAASPVFFEQLVIDLLVKMGYGGSRTDAARAVGRSGDGGIDGVIDEDRLGLDVIYVQAKRWDTAVGRPEIQKFAGALQGQRARKGIFITTSDFTREAEDYAQRIDSRIILINGRRLARLMFDFDVGATPRSTYTVKQLDSDYFEES
jgi:restriction system protein